MTPLDRTIIIARHPENEIDARWFTNEAEAIEHYEDFGDSYIYTAFNEAEGWSRPMNFEFSEQIETQLEDA